MTIGAVILAAGASTRFGQPKQLVSLDGECLARRAARTALEAGCCPVIVVVGHQSRRVETALKDLSVRITRNANWSSGMGASIRCGIEDLLHCGSQCGALLLMACDQPFVTAKAIDALARALTRSTVTIAASAYADTLGVPALFRRKWFPKLQTLPDAAGAKRLLAACPKETVPVAFPDGVHDIDFPIDLHRLIAIQRERQRNISTFPKVTSVD